MAKKKKASKKKEKVVSTDSDESIFESMSPETIRSIVGVVLFVCALILLLSALGLAGIAGEKLYDGIYYIIGVGYYLLPVILTGAAWMLIARGSYEYSKLRMLRSIGGLVFFVSMLGIIAVTASEEAAGKLSLLIVYPLVTYLDSIATLVILFGLLVISMLLLFDSSLWMFLGGKVRSLFKRESAEESLEAYPDTVDELEETEDPAETAAEEPEIEDDVDLETEEEEIPELPVAPVSESSGKKPKKEQVYQLPTKYNPPPLSILEGDRGKVNVGDTKIKANIIRKTLQHFKIPVEMDEVVVGPTVTRYSLKPAAGVRLSKIVALQSNLELALAASPIRIEAPIPGKSLVGIEVPNTGKSFVGLSGLLSAGDFTDETTPLFMALGKDIAGSAHYANIGKMPHLLVAGTTGSGKSVMIHSIVASLLYRNGPEQLRFIMVDPKRVELTLYDEIPHLLTPVITDAKKCILSLKWAAKEMERRYDILQEHKIQDIAGYHSEVVAPAHEKLEKMEKKGKDTTDVELPEPMPHIVIIIDELADIMTSYPRELEGAIVRLAQMSRAVGIHLILSTQRPSAQVITGLIKANIPARIALKVSSLLESRIILDQAGAEKLLGAGDMLYLSSDMPKPRRIQSPFLTTGEVRKIVSYIIKNNNLELPSVFDFSDGENGESHDAIPFDRIEQDEELDEIYEDVRNFVLREKKASTSLIQRRFKVGYGRAARIMDQLEERGVISASDGTNKPREVISEGYNLTGQDDYEETGEQDEEQYA